MFEAENIRDWRGLNVVDPDNHKIGTLEAIYVDTGTDVPSFATVVTGIIGRHKLTFVPLMGAKVAPDHLRVAYDRGQVKDAFSIDTDGELLATDEPKVFEHYGLPYTEGISERRLARR
jgi:PRC-barrel domain